MATYNDTNTFTVYISPFRCGLVRLAAEELTLSD